MKQVIKKIAPILFIFLFIIPQAKALSCEEINIGNFRVEKDIYLLRNNLNAGSIFWRSSTYKINLLCTGDFNADSAHLHWNPNKSLSFIDPSIKFGISINSKIYKLNSGEKIDLGFGTEIINSRRQNRQCQSRYYRNRHPTRCQHNIVIPLDFYIFAYATGFESKSKKISPRSNSHTIFQIGSTASTGTPNDSFHVILNDINRIQFASCEPTIKIKGTRGNEVNFGKIHTKNIASAQSTHFTNFSVIVDFNDSKTGNHCSGLALLGKFTSNNQIKNSNLLIPAAAEGSYGIQLREANGKRNPINFNESFEFGHSKSPSLKKDFIASIKWLDRNPKAGKFSAEASIEVTFR